MRDRIKTLLINGMKVSEVAGVVGCTPGYISQLLANEDFKKEIEIGRIELAAVATEEDHIDTRYKNMQHKLLTAMEGALGDASLGEITRAIEVVNKREDAKFLRKNPAPAVPIQQMNIISLNMPMHALSNTAPAVSLNSNQEIVAIDGKALAPLSSTGVKNLFAQLSASKEPICDVSDVKMLTAEDI